MEGRLINIIPALLGLGVSLIGAPYWAFTGVRKQTKETMVTRGISDDNWLKYIWIQPNITIGWALISLMMLSAAPASIGFLLMAVAPDRVELGGYLRVLSISVFALSFLSFMGFALYYGYKRK